jgi:integrase
VTGRRRGQGEGSIYRRPDGRWVAALDLGWRDGKRTRKYLYGRTRELVARKLARALAQQQQGYEFANERLTVEQFLARWLEAKRGTIRPGTWRRYEELVRLHVNPKIGRRRLARLKPEQLQQLYTELQARRSSATVLKVHRMLHSAFKLAVRWGAMPHNTTELVIAPTSQRHEFDTLTAEQARSFLKAAQGDRLEALLYVLAISTGMRQGELLGLRWQDVDLKRRRLQLVRQLKNRQSRRAVLLPALAATALVDHRARQAAEREQQGGCWEEHGLVFPNTVGRALNPDNLRQRSFFPLLARAGLPRIRFHDLRHSCATLLLSEGVHPKIVSDLLGHSQIGITLDLYSHVTATMQAVAAEAMGRLLGGQDDSNSDRSAPKPLGQVRGSPCESGLGRAAHCLGGAVAPARRHARDARPPGPPGRPP